MARQIPATLNSLPIQWEWAGYMAELELADDDLDWVAIPREKSGPLKNFPHTWATSLVHSDGYPLTPLLESVAPTSVPPEEQNVVVEAAG